MISGVIHGVIRPPVRATLSKGGGARRFAFTFDGQPFTFDGVSFTYGAP